MKHAPVHHRNPRPKFAPGPLGMLVAGATLAVACDARAEGRSPTHRKWGFGSAHGPSVAASTLWTAPGRVGAGTGTALFGLTLPTFEVQYFTSQRTSIDLSTSLSGTLFAAGFDRSLYFTQDAYVTLHLGSGVARFILGPGVGFSAAFHDGSDGAQQGTSLRLVSQLGLELLTKNEAFGFRILARPWLELAQTSTADDPGPVLGGGFAHHFAFFGYFRE